MRKLTKFVVVVVVDLCAERSRHYTRAHILFAFTQTLALSSSFMLTVEHTRTRRKKLFIFSNYIL